MLQSSELASHSDFDRADLQSAFNNDLASTFDYPRCYDTQSNGRKCLVIPLGFHDLGTSSAMEANPPKKRNRDKISNSEDGLESKILRRRKQVREASRRLRERRKNETESLRSEAQALDRLLNETTAYYKQELESLRQQIGSLKSTIAQLEIRNQMLSYQVKSSAMAGSDFDGKRFEEETNAAEAPRTEEKLSIWEEVITALGLDSM